ncbi:MAG: CHAP domain-containing protein [Candidatus Moranbacteria bacterium]|nr:CHAP domain-containing protein [Candidatus Moranbacteria bacterium]
MKKTIGLFLVLLFICCADVFGGYPYYDGHCRDDGHCQADNYGFCQSHCTSYAAWYLNEYWKSLGCQGIEFDNSFLQPSGNHWGDASNWKNAAERAGIPITGYPISLEVAWWSFGHVAIVKKVILDSGGAIAGIIVSEYNYEPCSYSERRIMKTEAEYPDAFLFLTYYVIKAKSMNMCNEDPTSDPDDGDPGKGGVTNPDPSGSSSKPDLFIKEVRYHDEKTKYYSDEKIKIEIKVKNSGKSVDSSIKKISVKGYQFKGEKENGDRKEIGDENIKGEHLKSGDTKNEEIEFDAPSEEGKYQNYVCVDTGNNVAESNEDNNCSGTIWYRVHKRPNLFLKSLLLNGGQLQFVPGEIVQAEAITGDSGGEPFEDVKAGFYLDGQFAGEENMRHYQFENHGEKSEETYITMPSALGSHNISACADYDNKHQETDESDNCYTVNFTVIEPPPTTSTTSTSIPVATSTTSVRTTSTTARSTTTSILPRTTTTVYRYSTTTTSIFENDYSHCIIQNIYIDTEYDDGTFDWIIDFKPEIFPWVEYVYFWGFVYDPQDGVLDRTSDYIICYDWIDGLPVNLYLWVYWEGNPYLIIPSSCPPECNANGPGQWYFSILPPTR